ncbi:unnamed protein product, partial [Prorocentrum cordatum]
PPLPWDRASLPDGPRRAPARPPRPTAAALAGPAGALAGALGARGGAEEPGAERLLFPGEGPPFREVVFGHRAAQDGVSPSRRAESPPDTPGATTTRASDGVDVSPAAGAAAAALAATAQEDSGLELPLPVAGVYVGRRINLPVHRERFLSFLDDFCPKTGVSRDAVRIVDGVNATEALRHSWPTELLPGIEQYPTQGQRGQLGLALAHLSAWKAVRDSPECQAPAGAEEPFSWEGPLRGDILGWGYRTDPADTLLACRKLCEEDGQCEAIQFSESAGDGPEQACVLHNNRSAWRSDQHVYKDFFMHFLTRDPSTENRYALVFEDDEKVNASFRDAVMAIVQATVHAPARPDFINLNCLRPRGDAVPAKLPGDARLQAVNKERDHDNECWNIDDATCPNVWMGRVSSSAHAAVRRCERSAGGHARPRVRRPAVHRQPHLRPRGLRHAAPAEQQHHDLGDLAAQLGDGAFGRGVGPQRHQQRGPAPAAHVSPARVPRRSHGGATAPSWAGAARRRVAGEGQEGGPREP